MHEPTTLPKPQLQPPPVPQPVPQAALLQPFPAETPPEPSACERSEAVPGDIMLGADGKLQRCPHDPQARASHRGASLATDHKAGRFTGYMVTSVAASCDYRHYGDPTTVHLRDDPGPYLLSFSCDPASHDRGPIARKVVLSLKSALPALNLVTADREFSERRESLVRPLHEHRINMVMDYPRPATESVAIVRVGTRGEVLYRIAGDFYPTWLPLEFRGPCPYKDPTERRDWHERRARFRYVPNGPLTATGASSSNARSAQDVRWAHIAPERAAGGTGNHRTSPRLAPANSGNGAATARSTSTPRNWTGGSPFPGAPAHRASCTGGAAPA